jgi:hypothetical protein
MPIIHHYTIFFDYLIIDIHQKQSFIGNFHNIQVPSLPAVLPSYYIVSAFSGGSGEHLRISFEDPDGETIATFFDQLIGDMNFLGDKKASVGVVVQPLQNVRFKEEGIHHVVLRQGDRVVHRQPFGVVVVPGGGTHAVPEA